jgi:hypothetical protein
MPLRDHFRAPFDAPDWESVHGGWPTFIVLQLKKVLPPRYVCGVRVHRGAQVEIDVGAFEKADPTIPVPASGNGPAYAPPAPTVVVETDLLDTDEYEVHVFDSQRNRRLVAAIEIVSPSNKDRADRRTAFVGKCEAMLRQGVSVSVVDLVTYRNFNLYAELLELIGQSDPTMGEEPPAIYAAACHWIERGSRHVLQTWSHALAVGRPLPTLPLWLAEDLAVPLELEASYEETCATFGS